MVDKASSFAPTVILADDSPLVIETVLALLSPDYNILRVAKDGEDALCLIETLRPDFAILDFCTRVLNGITVARRLKSCGIATRVILISQVEGEDYIEEARTVAHGFVFKRRLLNDLPLALISAARGSFYVSRCEQDIKQTLKI
jgi:DNA-binding NarL/FixJ family response regulator